MLFDIKYKYMNPIEYYTYLYPQLTLDVEEGISQTDKYKNIVLAGELPDDLSFPVQTSGKEERIVVETPVGPVECLYLPDRDIFERFIRVLAYKCEPKEIPRSTGAMLISGVNNWRKIYAHKDEFLKTHNESEWDDEFDRFILDRNNFKDNVLLISKGYYSALDYRKTKYDEEEYLRISKDLRIYHEITHHISRKLYPDHIDAVRDEIIADSIGLIYATNDYDSYLIKQFLGIEADEYRQGGRLQNYVEADKLNEAIEYSKTFIDKLDKFFKENKGKKPFEYLIQIEEDYIR